MLLSYEVTSASRAKEYFASSVSPEAIASRQDYYSEGQESPGWYSGKLGVELGLAGKPVDKATFELLCDNRRPDGKRLTPRTNEYRRVCYDFTVSGPKSFSIIEAWASAEERQRLRKVFADAVAETLAEDMEPDMQCRERAKGADHNIDTGNVLAAEYPHATARPEDDNTLPDPHWHHHLLIWNATRRPDGRIMAGQFGHLIRDKPYYRAAFYARLAEKLEGLGYAIERRGDVDWEIAGVPQSVIDKFSKRTAQIDGEAEKRGITDAASKAALGAKIRAKKQKELTMPELRKAWDAQLTDAERRALAAVYRKDVAADQKVTMAEAVAFAIEHCGEKLSVPPLRELRRVALLHGLGHVLPGPQLVAELQRQGVVTGEIDGRLMATTEALQGEEDYITGQTMSGRGSVAPVGVAEGLGRTMKDGKRLNDGQWDAVCGLLNSANRYNLVEGPAGAGKSSLLEKVDEGMTLAGEEVHYFATTVPAVKVLHDDGFTDAKTVAHLLADKKLQAAIRGKRIVVDEVSLLGHRDAVKLFRLAEENDLSITFCGDQMQHGAVARGAFMRVLKDYGGVTPFKLTEIIRQENPDYRAAAKLLSEGKTVEGFDAIDAMGRVEEIAEDADRNRHIAGDYLQAIKDKKSVLVVSPTHAEARGITAAIRCELRDAGRLGKKDHDVARLVAVNTSEAERRQASTYRNGPLVLQFHQNAKGFTKGDRLAVTDPAMVPLEHADKFSLYRPEADALAVKDHIRVTGNVRTLDGKHTLKNGMVRTVAAIGPKSIKLDNGWVIARDAGHWRHGYVETSFGSQGRTVQRVLLGMSAASIPAMNMEQLYVSASRAKQWIRLYTDDKAEIRDAVKRSSQKLAALDLRPKKPEPVATPEFRPWPGLHRHMEQRRRHSVIGWMRAAWDRATGHREKAKEHQPERQVDYGYGR